MNRVYATGDTHGTHNIHKLNTKNWGIGKELDKQDYLIIAGDYGFIWENEIDKTEEYWMKWFDSKPWTTLVVPGNHENYDRIFALPISEMFGGKVRKYNDSVIFLERGEIYNIAGKTFWVMGGGLSIDQGRRTIGISYWDQELISYEEGEHGMDTLKNVGGVVDYVITHVAPRIFIYRILEKTDIWTKGAKYNDPVSAYLEEIFKSHLKDYKMWYCGHYHVDKKLDDIHVLYNKVVKIF